MIKNIVSKWDEWIWKCIVLMKFCTRIENKIGKSDKKSSFIFIHANGNLINIVNLFD